MGQQLKQPFLERRLFTERVIIAVIIVMIAFLLLLSRYFYLQVISHQDYQIQADQNRIKYSRINPTRGLIYDRNGVLLADNITAYRLNIIQEKTRNLEQNLIDIQSTIQFSAEEIADIKEKLKFNPVFKPLTIKEKLTESEVAMFAVKRHRMAGFEIEPYLIRKYIYPNELSHLIGYVGKISPKEFKAQDVNVYSANDYFGKTGLEKYHENDLHGYPGQLVTEINAQGKQLSQKVKKPPVNGNNLELTIDIALQQSSYQAFGEETGSAITVDIATGEVLAMVSKPGYDTNDFINGISHLKFKALAESADKPLFDRSLKGGYEPGSTIKPYIALAGLYHDIIDKDDTMFSSGVYQIPNQERKYHDWKQGGHGKVDVIDSLTESVNVFFYDLAYRLGIDKIHDFLKPFKFGQLTGIDTAGEKQGILPSREWKEKNRDMIWFPGETVITGIGQGYFVLTPVQMAQALSILASKGRVAAIHLIKNDITVSQLPMNISDSDWNTVHQGMTNVINAPNGTARAIKSDQYLIAGKSGTSQVYGKSEEDIYKKVEELPKHLRNHALFIAFAPADDPQIAVVVVAEHGASGTKAAAPIAKKIIDAYMSQADE
ncbi:penicillin-binding protein 2 [Marinicella litoralis]|uniref:Peptidoglycan D,D-transpeptidase MrdA n=1 Tax=Marinicella litoralis TaxID=644220 RepID=A0A4R6XM49_9GAMM|nr:penicillin-binding protein 2 [Marinicella litoralis]TDR20725.1 peptidoglycan glycosyltransferase /cell elongation-specific peptidoglycan D,D-transpeptidase [Marinicella litoralis]